MNIKVSSYTPKDQTVFKNLVLESLKDFGFNYDPKYDSDLDEPSIYERNGGGLFLLKFDNEVAGSIAVINRGKIAELKRWYVAKNHRGKGFGTMLMDKALEFCKDKGFSKIEFETNKKFTKAHELYRERGFNILREDEESLYMSKDL